MGVSSPLELCDVMICMYVSLGRFINGEHHRWSGNCRHNVRVTGRKATTDEGNNVTPAPLISTVSSTADAAEVWRSLVVANEACNITRSARLSKDLCLVIKDRYIWCATSVYLQRKQSALIWNIIWYFIWWLNRILIIEQVIKNSFVVVMCENIHICRPYCRGSWYLRFVVLIRPCREQGCGRCKMWRHQGCSPVVVLGWFLFELKLWLVRILLSMCMES